MFLAHVTGTVWATQKSSALVGKRMLLVTKLAGNPPIPEGDAIMAVSDKIDAGIGDCVLVLDEGGSARSILGMGEAPIRTIIVGIVDHIEFTDSL